MVGSDAGTFSLNVVVLLLNAAADIDVNFKMLNY